MRRGAALVGAAFLGLAGAACAGPRVLSLDQCADQYVLALSPRTDIVGLSDRARNYDSYLRAEAAGLPERRATAESALGATPDVVVRYWGGDDRLVRDLERRGVRVLTIDDATDFPGIAADIRRVAAGLGQSNAGEGLIALMNRELATSAGAGKGRGVYYMTSGGDTQGPGTLVDAMIRAAGFTNLDGHAGFGVISAERLVMDPPSLIVLGFFDQHMESTERWGFGRQAAVKRIIESRADVSLPAAILGCPAWFAADGAAELASWARAHPMGR